jgi:hypothetical protein
VHDPRAHAHVGAGGDEVPVEVVAAGGHLARQPAWDAEGEAGAC